MLRQWNETRRERYEISLTRVGSTRSSPQDGGQTARVNPRIIHTRALQITAPAARARARARTPARPSGRKLSYLSPPPADPRGDRKYPHVFLLPVQTARNTSDAGDISRGARTLWTCTSMYQVECLDQWFITRYVVYKFLGLDSIRHEFRLVLKHLGITKYSVEWLFPSIIIESS